MAKHIQASLPKPEDLQLEAIITQGQDADLVNDVPIQDNLQPEIQEPETDSIVVTSIPDVIVPPAPIIVQVNLIPLVEPVSKPKESSTNIDMFSIETYHNENYGFTVTISGKPTKNGTFVLSLKKITKLVVIENTNVKISSSKLARIILAYLRTIVNIDGMHISEERKSKAILNFKTVNGI